MIYDMTLEIAQKGGGFESQEAGLAYKSIKESVEANQIVFTLNESFITIWKDKNMQKYLNDDPRYDLLK